MTDEGKAAQPLTSADGVTQRNPPLPASEEGTGMVPGDEGGAGSNTHLPASEADTSLISDDEKGPPPQSWPGRGGPGTIPPPG